MKNTNPKQLSEKELELLEARYYAGEKVSILIDEFQLDVAPSSLVQLLPTRVLDGTICPYCKVPMHQRPSSRSALKGGYGIPIPFCDACGHKSIGPCSCKNCQMTLEERYSSEQHVFERQLLELKHLERTCVTNPLNYSFQQAFYLVGLCRAGRCEDGSLIHSIQDQEVPLAPTKSLTIEIVQSLYNQQIIDISLSNTPDSFICGESGAIEPKWDLLQFDLDLGVDEQESLGIYNEHEAMLRNKEKWPAPWIDELLDLWRELALHECLRYLEVILNDHGFKFRAGTKTQQVLNDTLRNFSIAQICNLIWAAVRDASGYLLRERVSYQQAANTVVGSIQRKAERALSEGWSIKPFQRDYRCSESILAALFSHVTTSLGERYFTVAPSEITLKL